MFPLNNGTYAAGFGIAGIDIFHDNKNHMMLNHWNIKISDLFRYWLMLAIVEHGSFNPRLSNDNFSHSLK
jgi:hypothetical protein